MSDILSAPATRRTDWRTHAVILVAAASVPLLGLVMQTAGSEQVAFRGWEASPLPPLCVSSWLGFRCPTCGVTRSVIALMAGDFQSSIAFHRFGWLILLLIVVQIPYRVVRLIRPERRFPTVEQAGIALAALIAAVVILNWLAELFIL